MQKLLVFVNSVIAAFTLCSYISGFVNPEVAGIFSLFGLLYPYLLILNVFFILFWLIVKWKKSFISIFTLLIGWGHLISFFGLDVKDAVEITSRDLNIGSFNINAGYFIRNNDREQEKESTRFLNKQFLNSDVDIFCLQEYNFYIKQMLKQLLPNYHLAEHKDNSVAIYSKYPILQSGELDFKLQSQKCVWADLQYKDDTIRVYSIHLFSNKLTRKTQEIMEERDFNNEEAYRDIKYIFGRYIKSSKRRVFELEVLQKHMSKSPYPIILSGDFNDTPQSYTHNQLMRAGFCDAFQERGNGLGYTYNGPLPLLRIDYTFVTQDFEVLSHEVIRKKMSDHYPIKTTVRLEK